MAHHGSLHLSRPLGPAALGVQPTVAPLRVVIQPQVSPKNEIRETVYPLFTLLTTVLSPGRPFSPSSITAPAAHPTNNESLAHS